ncbi:hypothetical protein G159_07620 [Planococcus glaciei CHR43]|nr:hypothetical protein G159_07620 [Planococcus glaciei CHR43]
MGFQSFVNLNQIPYFVIIINFEEFVNENA